MNLYVGNDNLVRLTGLYDAIAETYVVTATVTFTLTDEDNATVASGALAYVNGTNGDYQGVVEDDASITPNGDYTLTVNVDAGNDRIGMWTVHTRALKRS